MSAICCGVALSPASAAAGSAGTIRISRKVTISSPNSDGIADSVRRRMKRSTAVARQPSGGEVHPTHLAAAPHRTMPEPLNPVRDAADLDHVVDPDVGR